MVAEEHGMEDEGGAAGGPALVVDVPTRASVSLSEDLTDFPFGQAGTEP